MDPSFNLAISKITHGLYFMAGYAVLLALVSAVVANKYGGKTKQRRKATAQLVWAAGMVLFVLIAMPRFFS